MITGEGIHLRPSQEPILAYQGGEPPASFEALRLVVPGDSHGGRSVRDVARIEIR